MSNKSIKINIEEAIKYYNSSSDPGFKQLLEDTFGKNFWKPKLITDIVFDINSLLKYTELKLPYNLNTTISFERYLNSCSILAKVAEIYNEGTVLDWNNLNIYKYIPYKYFSGGRLVVHASAYWYNILYGSGRLYYKSALLSEKSYNNFKIYWEDFWSFK